MRRSIVLGLVLLAMSVASPVMAGRGPTRGAQQNDLAIPENPYGFADSLLGQLMRFFPDSVRWARLAVFPLLNNTRDQSITGGVWIAEYYAQQLRANDRFILVDRRRFRRALREFDLTIRDYIDDGLATELAKFLGVKYMLVGSVEPGPSKNYKVEARIVDVNTGIIVTGAAMMATGAQMYYVEHDLLEKREETAIQPAFVRSFFLPGLGQIYRKQYIPGAVFMAGFVGALGATAYFAVPAWKAYDEYVTYREESEDEFTNPDLFDAKGDKLFDDFKEELTPVLLSVSAAAAVWAGNLVWVSVSGAQKSSEYRLYFTGDFREEFGVGVCWDF